jgi:hypothetical protein
VCVREGSATLSGTLVSSNSASDGGGVFVLGGSTMLSRTQIISNSASRDGGGVYVSVGSAVLSGTHVTGNSASDDGGGVFVYQGSATLDVSGGEIGDNSASDNGGGVCVEQGSATLSGTLVASNSAQYYGGGVYIDEGDATLSGTRIHSNSATSNGGGLYLADHGKITAVDGCIVHNSDTAVHCVYVKLTATDNWWGAPDGPSGAGPGSGDSVSAYVNYANHKTSAPDGCLAYPTEWHIYLPLAVRND